jgi:serine/threonine protein kinase
MTPPALERCAPDGERQSIRSDVRRPFERYRSIPLNSQATIAAAPHCIVPIGVIMPLGPGARLGPYEVIGSLGAGGMGEVLRARDTRLGREVAIKVVRAGSADDQDDSGRRLRFQREARAIASLSHPHICTIHDVGTEGGIDFLVLELLPGERSWTLALPGLPAGRPTSPWPRQARPRHR